MSQVLTIALLSEGSTDQRFLESVVLRTFETLAASSPRIVDVAPIIHLSNKKGSYVENVLNAASQCFELGVSILCLHADADGRTNANVRRNKIEPALSELGRMGTANLCTNTAIVIPVQMMEAWILTNSELLLNEVGCTDPMIGRNLNAKKPEQYADPKQIIEDALSQCQNDQFSKRRKKIVLSDLYQILGQTIELRDLEKTLSYRSFKEQAETAMERLHLL